MELEESAPAAADKRIFPVRLGKFRSSNNGGNPSATASSSNPRSEEAEMRGSSSSSLDARRCFSMGSYQYVVADCSLQVELSSGKKNGDGGEGRGPRRTTAEEDAANGKKLWAGSKGDSFSVSKIWQWSGKKPKLSSSSDSQGLPWMQRTERGGT